MQSSETAVQPVAAADARFHRISNDCWDLLNYFRRHNWEATALALVCEVNPLGYRQRLTELRQKFLIDIRPFPEHPRDGEVAIYKCAPERRPRAEYLLTHGSLEGFAAASVQKGLFT